MKKYQFFVICLFSFIAWILLSSFVRNRAQDQEKIEMPQNSNLAKVVTERSKCKEQDTLSEAKACTVLVIRNDGGHGSGFSIIHGYIVTNKHLVENAKKLTTWLSGKEVSLILWNYSPTHDIAILKLSDEFMYLPTCKWFNSAVLKMAETLYAVGWPAEPTGESTITKGILSRLNKFEGGVEFIQTDAAINPGSSGGPLINECGVVGINTLKEFWSNERLPRPLEGLGNALVSNSIIDLIETLIKEGKESNELLVSKKTKASYNPKIPQETNPTLYLDINVIHNHLISIRQTKNSWEPMPAWIAKSTGLTNLWERMVDSLNRQILFCDTLIQHLESGKSITRDNIFMWDSIVKMSYESAELARMLNVFPFR